MKEREALWEVEGRERRAATARWGEVGFGREREGERGVRARESQGIKRRGVRTILREAEQSKVVSAERERSLPCAQTNETHSEILVKSASASPSPTHGRTYRSGGGCCAYAHQYVSRGWSSATRMTWRVSLTSEGGARDTQRERRTKVAAAHESEAHPAAHHGRVQLQVLLEALLVVPHLQGSRRGADVSGHAHGRQDRGEGTHRVQPRALVAWGAVQVVVAELGGKEALDAWETGSRSAGRSALRCAPSSDRDEPGRDTPALSAASSSAYWAEIAGPLRALTTASTPRSASANRSTS